MNKEEIIDNHRKMWSYIVSYLKSCEEDTLETIYDKKMEYLKSIDYKKPLVDACFLCEYAKDKSIECGEEFYDELGKCRYCLAKKFSREEIRGLGVSFYNDSCMQGLYYAVSSHCFSINQKIKFAEMIRDVEL